MKKQIYVPGLETGFHPYPAAVKHAGLVFVSGVRSTGSARSAVKAEMPKHRLTKEQGFGLADHDENKVSVCPPSALIGQNGWIEEGRVSGSS